MAAHDHCHHCGTAYAAGAGFPKTCPGCNETIWSNPLPVANVLVRMDGGLLLVKRGIEPAKGFWALPGGFLETGESWQEGAVREVREETGLVLPASEIQLVDALSVAQNRQIILWCITKSEFSFADFTFAQSPETEAVRVMKEPEALAFAGHTKYAVQYLNEKMGIRG